MTFPPFLGRRLKENHDILSTMLRFTCRKPYITYNMNQGAFSYMRSTPRISANLLRHCGGFGDGSVPGTFGPGTGRCDVCHGERFIQPPPGRERGGRVGREWRV